MSTNSHWSYLVIDLSSATSFFSGMVKNDALQEELNKHGRQGWELVNLVIPGGMVQGKAVFKKET